jgi:hypothetical protein
MTAMDGSRYCMRQRVAVGLHVRLLGRTHALSSGRQFFNVSEKTDCRRICVQSGITETGHSDMLRN